MRNYAVLGAGYMGTFLAKQIVSTNSENLVTLIDLKKTSLERAYRFINSDRIAIEAIDLNDEVAAVQKMRGHDIAISALPHSVAKQGMKIAVSAGVSLVDLVGEGPDAQLKFDADALKAGITVLPDMGVAPGLSNICVGRGVVLLDEAENAIIYVGGVPKEKEPPLYYQTLYRLKSVFNAYNRSVPIIRNGALVEVEPLSGTERISFGAPIGELEAFYTDGLNSLIVTMRDKISGNLAEKTLRYPGHIARIKILKECGLLDTAPVIVGGEKVSPIDVTVSALGPKLALSEKGDYLAMRVLVSGMKDGKRRTHRFELIDEFDPASGYTAMARTTCFPALIAMEMILNGAITEKGVVFPELLFTGGLYEAFMTALRKQNIDIVHIVE